MPTKLVPRAAALAGAVATIALPAAAQQTPPQLTQPSSFRLLPRTEECTFGYQTTNVRYTVVGATAVEAPDWPHLVLEERTSIQQCENLEGPTQAEVSVTARPAAHPGAPPRWTIRRRGEDAAVVDSFAGHALYRITEYGCCGSENLDAYYSLVTGRELFTTDHPLLFIDVRPFGTGFVAVHDAQAAVSPGAENDRTLVAVVAFGGAGGAVQRLAIHGPSNEFYLPRMELLAWNPAGGDRHGKHAQSLDAGSGIDARWMVTIDIGIEGMTEGQPTGHVQIPIQNGRMVVERATVNAPFRIAAMPAR